MSAACAVIAMSFSAYATDYTLTSTTSPTTLSDKDQDVFGEIGLGFVNIEEDSDELRLLTKAKFSDKVTEYSASLDYNVNF